MSSHSLAMCCSAKQRDDLLAFAKVLDEKLVEVPNGLILALLIRAVCVYCMKKTHLDCYWTRAGINSTISFPEVSSGPRSGDNATNTPSEFIGGESQLSSTCTSFCVGSWDHSTWLCCSFSSTIAHLCAVNAERVGKSQLMTEHPILIG